MDKILEEQGLNYEDLNPAERETYQRGNFELKKLTTADVKEHVAYIKNSVALQLCDTPEGDPKNPVLKARLKNYIVMESFLTKPDKAEEAMKKQIEMRGKKS